MRLIDTIICKWLPADWARMDLVVCEKIQSHNDARLPARNDDCLLSSETVFDLHERIVARHDAAVMVANNED